MHKQTISSFQNHITKKLKTKKIRDCQINTEGNIYAKCQLVQILLIKYEILVAAIQETTAESEDQMYRRGRLAGYDLLNSTYHHAHGIATYVKSNIENTHMCSFSTRNNIHTVIVKIGEVAHN